MTGPAHPSLPSVRSRPSDTAEPPEDVTDVLLWRTAYDVAAAHTADPATACTNLVCATQPGRCQVAALARRALQLARTPQPEPTPPNQAVATALGAPAGVGEARPNPTVRGAVGRAAVTYRRRFTGWFTAPVSARAPAADALPRHAAHGRRPPPEIGAA